MKFFLLFVLLFNAACVETVAVGTVVAGVVVSRDKNIEQSKNDALISTKINFSLLQNKLRGIDSNIKATVSENRVLLTGATKDIDNAKKAYNIAWKIDGVEEVIDEINLEEPRKKSVGFFVDEFNQSMIDSFITTKIRAKMLADRKISSANYHVITSNQVVYLIGLAQNDLELKQVFKRVAKTYGVKKVVNHVILKNDKRYKRLQ